MKKEIVVFTNGCFDILHVGHVRFLKFCAAQGDKLIVGLNSDESVTRLKGQFRPINNQEDRKKMLTLINVGVTNVVFFDENTPLRLIKKIRPDILVKGSDWEGNVVGQEFIESYGGKVILYRHSSEHSTSKIIEKVRKEYGKLSKTSL